MLFVRFIPNQHIVVLLWLLNRGFSIVQNQKLENRSLTNRRAKFTAVNPARFLLRCYLLCRLLWSPKDKVLIFLFATACVLSDKDLRNSSWSLYSVFYFSFFTLQSKFWKSKIVGRLLLNIMNDVTDKEITENNYLQFMRLFLV